jgi:hypothetical protein
MGQDRVMEAFVNEQIQRRGPVLNVASAVNQETVRFAVQFIAERCLAGRLVVALGGAVVLGLVAGLVGGAAAYFVASLGVALRVLGYTLACGGVLGVYALLSSERAKSRPQFFVNWRKMAMASGVVVCFYRLDGYGPIVNMYVGPLEFRLVW